MATVKKEGEKPTCSHCQKGQDVSKCWKLHPELRPKKYRGNKDKGKYKATAVVIQDLGSDSSDETKVTAVEIQGKDKSISLPIDAQPSSSASTSLPSTSKQNDKIEVHCFMFVSLQIIQILIHCLIVGHK